MDKKVYLKIISNTVPFLVFVLCFCPLSFAEVIYLKSGKNVEGQIIGKTDTFVKVKFHGVVLTYYWDDIGHIDGEFSQTSLRKEKDKVESGVTGTLKTETVEQQQVLNFISKSAAIIKDMNDKLANKKESLIKSTLVGNRKKMTKVTSEMRDIIKQHKQQVLALSPPSSCNKLKSVTVQWFQVNEDIHNELVKNNVQKAKLLEKQLINYLYKMKEESEHLTQYYQNKEK